MEGGKGKGKPTAAQLRRAGVLAYLVQSGGEYPASLYPVIFPLGRFNTDVDHGSAKGGPSKREYAVNCYMGKLQRLGLVFRYGFRDERALDRLRGKWVVTTSGRQAAERGAQ